MAKQYYQGKYKPKHPNKYDGDPTNIIYRSSWELKFCNWCDYNPNVIQWSSEEVVIPYLCCTDNKVHRYYVDFKIQVKDKSNQIKTYLVEIKPQSQTQEPKKRKKTKKYIQEVMLYGKNTSKWKAAQEYCKDRGWHFKIITEQELNI